MSKEADAREFHNLVSSIARGGAPTPAGIFGPFGTDRGLREELLAKAGAVAGKITHAKLSENEAKEFLALCGVAEASSVMSRSDYDAINDILERNI